jgi:hypothetical protein
MPFLLCRLVDRSLARGGGAVGRPSCTCVLNIRQKPSNPNGNRGAEGQQKLEPKRHLGRLENDAAS